MNDVTYITIIAGCFTVLGGAIGAFTAWTIANRSAAIENQRQLRELGFRIATANFELYSKQCQIVINNASVGPVEILQLSVFVAEGMKIAEIVGNPRFNGYEIGLELNRLPQFKKNIQKGMES